MQELWKELPHRLAYGLILVTIVYDQSDTVDAYFDSVKSINLLTKAVLQAWIHNWFNLR